MEDVALYCRMCVHMYMFICVLFVGTERTLKVQKVKFQSGNKGHKHLRYST